MKVTYRERNFIDKYRCIDRPITRNFNTIWEFGGLIYFKLGQFTIFSIAKEDIISISE